jgi:GT2 family glycosyltransferase
VLGRLRAALAERTDAVAVPPRSVVFEDPGRVHYDSGRFHYAGVMSLRNFFVPLAEAEGEGVVDVDGLVALTALVDREAVGTAGGFDESLFYLMEDYELSLRLRLRGGAILAVEDALVGHKGGTAGLSFREEREGARYPGRRAYYHSRNRLMILAKNHRLRTLVFTAPALLLYELVWLGFSALKGNLLPTLSGKVGFLAQLPGVLQARRDVQRTRVVRDRDLLVGGPLTLTPQLVAKPVARSLVRGLDAALRAWWALVRPLCG